MKRDKIEYIKNEFPGAPDILVIEGNGQVRYESHSNEAAPDSPEIGTWRTSLRTEQMESLDKVLDSPSFKTLPDHWGRLRPGEDCRRIRTIAGSDTTEKLVGYRESVDPGMQRVIDALDRIVIEAKSHPDQVLRISLTKVSIGPDMGLTATLTLSDPGTVSVISRNPARMIGESDGQITFQAWPDKPRSELHPEDLIVLTPTGVDDTRAIGKPPGAPAWLELGPGASVSFGIHLPVGKRTAGRYLIRAFYMNTAKQIEQHSVMVGEVYSQTTTMSVP